MKKNNILKITAIGLTVFFMMFSIFMGLISALQTI